MYTTQKVRGKKRSKEVLSILFITTLCLCRWGGGGEDWGCLPSTLSVSSCAIQQALFQGCWWEATQETGTHEVERDSDRKEAVPDSSGTKQPWHTTSTTVGLWQSCQNQPARWASLTCGTNLQNVKTTLTAIFQWVIAILNLSTGGHTIIPEQFNNRRLWLLMSVSSFRVWFGGIFYV